MHWLIEEGVFAPPYFAQMTAAVRAAGHTRVRWRSSWEGGPLPVLSGPVMFHGSLENAARLAGRGWALCDAEAMRCARWYPGAAPWLLHSRYRILPADQLVADPVAVLGALGLDRAFIRPDSPLKPFSGRILAAGDITLTALDHGFYFQDPTIDVVVAPVRAVGREWRFVVVDREVIAGSAYTADGRVAGPAAQHDAVWQHAGDIARQLPMPEPVVVLDLCEADGALHLLELNPFSGADLYGCDLTAVVSAVSQHTLAP